MSRKFYEIKRYTPYVKGVVGQETTMSFWQRLRLLLFHKGVAVVLISDQLKRSKEK